jgi:hypothetical protein
MAKAAEVVPIDGQEEKAEQLAMFEVTAVNEYKASLTAAGWLDLDDQLKVGPRVAIQGEGWVTKVVFHKHKGIVTRQHIIAADVETVEIKSV